MAGSRPFLIDVDGVCAEFSDHLLTLCGSNVRKEAIRKWDIFWYLTDDQANLAHEILEDPIFWATQVPIAGAQAGIEELRRHGEVVFVTAPWWSCKEWEHVRRIWLQRHFAAGRREIISSPRKDIVAGRGFLDDKPDHVRGWDAFHEDSHAVLFDSHSNVDEKWPHRFKWEDGVERLLAMFDGDNYWHGADD